jgi:uncharacterized protein DUF6011
MSTPTMNRNFARNTQGQARKPNPATARQVEFLVDLVKQIGAYNAERGRVIWAEMREIEQSGQLTFTAASARIDQLKAERTEHRLGQWTDPAEDQSNWPEIPIGRYAVHTDEGHLAFYQLKERDGRVEVYLQLSSELRKLSNVTALAIISKILAVGIEEAMARYGKELKFCGAPKCGRPLTNEESRDRGIGPVCIEKMGF